MPRAASLRSSPCTGSSSMDALYLALIAAFAAALFGLVAGCAALGARR